MKCIPVILAMLLLVGAIMPGLASSQDSELILRVAMQADMKGTNPLTCTDVWSWNVLGYLYDGPVNVDPDTDELIPYIAIGSANISGKAESWDDCAIGNFGYSPKSGWENASLQETMIFYDFENVFWHDGVQMNISDVMFSMHMAAQVPEWSGSMDLLKADNFTQTSWLHVYNVWESADELQAALRFQLCTPYADFFRGTLSTFLLPEHIWAYKISGQAVDGAKIWCNPGYNISLTDSWKVAAAQSYFNNPPIGSGPFKFEFWTKGQMSKIVTYRDHFFRDDYKYIDYVGTDEYGRSNARQPNIDAITYKIYKTAEAAVLALKADDIDYIAWSVPATFVQELSNEQGIALQQTPEKGFHYLAYNMRRKSFGYNESGQDVGKPLRQVIAHCIDKEKIVRYELNNLGIAGTGPVSSLGEWYNASIPTYDFNISKAKQILADAGYKVKTTDGKLVEGDEAIALAGMPYGNWWVNPDGTNIGSSTDGKIEILAPEMSYVIRNFYWPAMIARQLRDIGIYAEAVAMDFGSIVDRIDQRDFDMYILGWSIGSEPADFLNAFYHSDNADYGQNYAGYRNSSFDAVMNLARSTGDFAVKKDAIFEAQASICYDLPNDVIYHRINIEAYRSDRFVGWVSGESGTIFNWESIKNIRSPGIWKANAQFVSPPSAVVSNSTTPLTIFVKDQDGNPLEGALVLLNASLGTLSATEIVSGPNGRITVDFIAPYSDPLDPDAVENGTQTVIQIVAATYFSPNGTIYDPAPSRLTLVHVYPAGAQFISLSMSADPDIIDPDMAEDGTPGFAFVEVRVIDQNGDPVAGATVALTISPDVPKIEPMEQQTDADGKATFKVTSSDLPKDDDSIAQFTLAAIALHPTNPLLQSRNSVIIQVVDAQPPIHGDPPFSFPAFEVAITLAAIFVVATAFAYIVRRKRK
ncbi:MAG: Ig-like domain-containing protein [Candidatus Thermoplasmatota archaeon]|nr:hypothetical protein [Euryarchaeota archaeon]MBU4033040.1 Ig-like domain-containing protein [Candidatus Thermoplasmatota archaeon]MBU4070888.1 Ig-like domain-containing protein [Candidatus Thermoplasmatota archaeon]MBU4144790.1 Ig-like domain-containing protein [Candidatus Thermoplasmatota archaeon]MBU4591452.1 Ig-like domain-containing protein [Candidatus Thermoplasmatota archaeon]